MKNITLSLDDKMIKLGREYAKNHQTTLNNLIRELLEKTISQKSQTWLEDCFHKMDKAKGNSKGWKWNREEIYDV